MDASTAIRQRGFTLPELLVAGVLILVFVGVMLAIVRSANYTPEHRNAQRRLDLVTIMKAITLYKVTVGSLPPTIAAQDTPIATLVDGPNLCDDLVPTFLNDMPLDPAKGGKLDNDVCSAEGQIYDSGYTARVEAGRIILAAPAAERGEDISLQRWFPIL